MISILCVVVILLSGDSVTGVHTGMFSSDQTLQTHNAKRQLHQDTPDLRNDYYLAVDAQQCAKDIIEKHLDASKHPCNPKDGENIYVSSGTFGGASIAAAVRAWYCEMKHIDFNNPHWNLKVQASQVGHLTQMLWRSTKTVGCGWAIGSKTVIVCRYAPLGNSFYGAHIKENVKPLKSVAGGCEDKMPASTCNNFKQHCEGPLAATAKDLCQKTCNSCGSSSIANC